MLILFVAIAFATGTVQCASKGWRNDILRGVTQVPGHGTPGAIYLWDNSNSEAIMTTHQTKKLEVIIAAAEIGRGRIIVTGADGYARQFLYQSWVSRTFYGNWVKWLTRGKTSSSSIAKDASRSIPSAGQIAVLHGQKITREHARSILTFVKNGGSAVIGRTPWAYQWYTDLGKPITSDAYYEILAPAGLSFDVEYALMTNTHYSVRDNRAAQSQYVLPVLSQISSDSNKLSTYGDMVSNALKDAPVQLTNQYKYSSALSRVLNTVRRIATGIRGTAKSVKDRAALALTGSILSLSSYVSKPQKAPGIDRFPGEVSSGDRKTVSLEVTPTFENERHSTGYYLAAGEAMTVAITSGNIKGWSCRIGAHSDSLVGKDEYKRYPIISRLFPLSSGTNKIHTPFGGSIYFENAKGSSTLKVKMTNVVEAPYVDLTDSNSVRAWNTRKKAPAPWAELAGETIIFSMPSSSVINTDALAALRVWDKSVKLQHHLRGTDWKKQKRERTVTDKQISAGYMHAGYPIMTHLDVAQPHDRTFLMDAKKITTIGNWGMFHEIGHNFQRPSWTFDGTGEVTNNIYTMICMDKISGQPIYDTGFIKDQTRNTERYLLDGANFNKWKQDAGVALNIFGQIGHHFGWEIYKQFFRKYEQGKVNPQSQQDKQDAWLTTLSEISSYNLSPIFDFWGFKVSYNAKNKAKANGRRAFFPDDKLTKLSASRSNTVIRQYSPVRKVSKMRDVTRDNNYGRSKGSLRVLSVTSYRSRYYYGYTMPSAVIFDGYHASHEEHLLEGHSCGGNSERV